MPLISERRSNTDVQSKFDIFSPFIHDLSFILGKAQKYVKYLGLGPKSLRLFFAVRLTPFPPLAPLIHPVLKREDRLGKEPFAGFGTVVEDITESGYTKNQPILLGFF